MCLETRLIWDRNPLLHPFLADESHTFSWETIYPKKKNCHTEILSAVTSLARWWHAAVTPPSLTVTPPKRGTQSEKSHLRPSALQSLFLSESHQVGEYRGIYLYRIKAANIFLLLFFCWKENVSNSLDEI